MKKISFIISVFLVDACFGNSTFVEIERIVGGKVIPLSDVPYQVSVQNKGRHECGGAIISQNFVLTAAHCVYINRPRDITIRVGTDSVGIGGEMFNVKRIKSHPLFNPFTYNNDFAILELTTKITMKAGFKEIIELPVQDDPITDGTLTLVSGWGDTRKENESSDVLRGAIIPTVNQKRCKESYYNLSNQMFCAGDVIKGGIDSCQGDSGGPIKRLSDNKLIGIVSFGRGCAQPNFPGVYSRVASVRSWITTAAKIRTF